MKKNLKNLLLGAVATLSTAAALSSCVGDGETIITESIFATVCYNADSTWYVEDDNNLKLYVKGNENYQTKPTPNARVYILFDNCEHDSRPNYDAVIEISYLLYVNIQDVKPLSTDSLNAMLAANDAVMDLRAAYIGRGYLNLDFAHPFGFKAEEHTILVACDSAHLDSVPLNIYLLREDHGDVGTQNARRVLSVDLENLKPLVERDSIGIVLNVFYPYETNPLQIRMGYKFKN